MQRFRAWSSRKSGWDTLFLRMARTKTIATKKKENIKTHGQEKFE